MKKSCILLLSLLTACGGGNKESKNQKDGSNSRSEINSESVPLVQQKSPYKLTQIQRNTQFGRYVGVLQHANIKKDQYAKLDFITSRNTSNDLELKAVLSLYFGDFSSKEYVTYHFDNVVYNFATGSLIFDQTDQGVSISSVKFENGKLEGVIRSNLAGVTGTIKLEQNGIATPTRPVMQQLWGEYVGRCKNTKKSIHLTTYKSTSDTVRIGDPFGAYEIKGRIGEDNQNLCPNEQGRSCTMNSMLSGTYNFFEGYLSLLGTHGDPVCKVDGRILDCGGCVYERKKGNTSESNSYPDANTPVVTTNKLLLGENTSPSEVSHRIDNSVEGEYVGYLHHESLDLYQPASINILTYQNTGSQSFQMSAVAKIFFGEPGSSERLTYKFQPRKFNLFDQIFVFDRVEDDVDAVLQITSIGNGVVKGFWYSILFGRVGSFMLKKGEYEPLPSHLSGYESLARQYETPAMKLNLAVRLDQTPNNTENPFFPLSFGGYFYYKAGFARRIDITGGSYDFYTGRIALETEDGSRVAVGENLTSQKTLSLQWPSKKIGTLFSDWGYKMFAPVNK